jgi:LuxR family maltose regulon positive regulatory protein
MDPILRTKLYIPAVHPDRIFRSQLICKLNQDLWSVRNEIFLRRLTLIAAPAGYGKSTLLHEWVNHLDLPVAWITFDDSDSHPDRFLQYIVASLQTIQPGLGQSGLSALLSSSTPISHELISNFIISLINDLAEVKHPFLLVFDDYHTLQNKDIHLAVVQMLEHMPQTLSLVIATRSMPMLPLSRLRSRRQMAEIRANDLKFSEDEASDYFRKTMQLDLKDDEVRELTEITEGWVTGLQLAGLALQGVDDRASYIHRFNGRERFIIDYLFEEVFARQSEPIQNFLLRTSILERLSGSICDAITINQDGNESFLSTDTQASQSILEYLENANLFLVSLDDERTHYRYNHLFADLLRHRLRHNFPDMLPVLHARAAMWFELHENPHEAFSHWIAAGNEMKAAQIIEKYGYHYFERADFPPLSNWLEQLTPELIKSFPWLCIFNSWGLIFTGCYDEADIYLTSAEKKIGAISEESPAEQREQFGHVAAARAFLATRSQNAEEITYYSDLAMKYVSTDKRALRSYIAFFVGTGRYKRNQYSLAQSAWREAARLGLEAGNNMMAVNGLVTLGEQHRIQGKLHESLRVFEEAEKLAMDERGIALPVSAEIYVSRARLHYEWNDFEAAETYLAEAAKLMKFYPGFDLKVEYNIGLSDLRIAQGNLADAASLIHEIEASGRQPFYKAAAAFLACRINYYLMIGDVEEVRQIINQHEWNPEEKNIFAWAEAFIAYARWFIFENDYDSADDLLEVCRQKLENYGLWAPAIKVLIIQACISQRSGKDALAQKQIQRALTLAEPESFMRTFINEDEEVKNLIIAARSVFAQIGNADQKNLRIISYIDRLNGGAFTDICETIEKPKLELDSMSDLIVPLTERELEILQLIENGFSNKEIAEKLFVTIGTVKTHTSNIYRKLDVPGRTKALAKARELNLI